jgi:gliding motility-associated-like protein
MTIKPFIPFLFLIFGFAQCSNAQSCVPVLASNNHSLCQNDTARLILSAVYVPSVGCRLKGNTPFRFYTPSNAVGTPSANAVYSLPTPFAAGLYKASVLVEQDPAESIPCPCLAGGTEAMLNTNTIRVKPTPAPPIVPSPAPSISCGSTATLSATTNNTGTGTMEWFASSTDLSNPLYIGNPYITPVLTSDKTYSVRYRSENCVSIILPFSVSVTAIPKPSVTDSIVTIYCNNTALLRADDNGNGEVYWYKDSGLNNLVGIGTEFVTPVLQTDTAYYIVTKNQTCASTKLRLRVMVKKTIAPTISSLTSFCAGQPVSLSVTRNAGNTATGSIEWFVRSSSTVGTAIGSGNPFAILPALLNPSNRFYTRETIQGCVSDTSTAIAIKINALPVFTTPSPVTVCENVAVTLANLSTIYTYTWSGPNNYSSTSNTPKIINTKTTHEGTYSIVATDATTGCKSLPVNINLYVTPAPIIGLQATHTISDGSSIVLSASGGNIYSWKPATYLSDSAAFNPRFTPPLLLSDKDTSYIYEVWVKDAQTDCTAVGSTAIKVEAKDASIPLKIYTLITPNNDGKNDIWYIDYLNRYKDYVIDVMDASGGRIYHFDTASDAGVIYEDKPWEGNNMNGSRTVPNGVYSYIIHIKDIDKTYRGGITLLNK